MSIVEQIADHWPGTITELAKRSGLARSHASRILGGHLDPQLSRVERLAEGAGGKLVFVAAAAQYERSLLGGDAVSPPERTEP